MKKIGNFIVVTIVVFLASIKNVYAAGVSIEQINCFNTYEGNKLNLYANVNGMNITADDAQFSDVGDNLTCTIKIKNDTSEKREIDSKKITSLSNTNFRYSITGNGGLTISPNTSKEFTIEVKYIEEYATNKRVKNNVVFRVGDPIVNPKTFSPLLALQLLVLLSLIPLFLFKKKKKMQLLAIIAITGYTSIITNVNALESIDLTFTNNIIIDKKVNRFLSDSWETIKNNVEKDLSYYPVGSTKEVDLGSYGKHTVRVSNNTVPTECSTVGFSQTACGFVVEFADIISKHSFNPAGVANGISYPLGSNVYGWHGSYIRTYLNDVTVPESIINALPADLRDVIISVNIVSGHGSDDPDNFNSIAKLYLLSELEVWKTGPDTIPSCQSLRDTIAGKTRQLDYYEQADVSTDRNKYAAVLKKYNGEVTSWWLRTPSPSDNYNVSIVSFFENMCGSATDGAIASQENGVSPAFRI